jgi:ABC-type amino acid transport substrate-binding protein
MFPGLALAMLLWLAPANAADPTASGEPLIVSQDHVWPPFAFRDEKGQPRGLLVEMNS